MVRKVLLIFGIFILLITGKSYSLSSSKAVIEGYNKEINDYMGSFITVYSNDAVDGTNNLKIDKAEDKENDIVIYRYSTADKGVIRYRFSKEDEGSSNNIDYYIISPSLIMISNVTVVKSSEFLSSTKDDILCTNLSKYLVINGKLNRYVPELNMLFSSFSNPDKLYTSQEQLSSAFNNFLNK